MILKIYKNIVHDDKNVYAKFHFDEQKILAI